MIIKNTNIIFPDCIQKGSLKIENGKIKEIGSSISGSEPVIDGEGMYLSPGFIDIHIHGAAGADTMDGSYDALNTISKAIAKHGTTSFLPTTMTMGKDSIKTALESVSEAKQKGTDGANVLGCHLEGPFISGSAIGAQNPKYVLKPSVEDFLDMAGSHIEDVVTLTMAPEVEGAGELIKFLSSNHIKTSMGHTSATYDQAVYGIKCGICHSTHLYNAMTPLHHRNPGAVGAIFDSGITTEIIADGIHIAYPSIRTALKQKGLDKVMLISDAMMACTMPDGNYTLGGQKVIVTEGAARLENGSLAGSVLTLDRAVRNIKNNTPYPLHEIVRMVTYNPACHCNVQDRKGIIKEGYDADLILFDEDINIKKVIIGGNELSDEVE